MWFVFLPRLGLMDARGFSLSFFHDEGSVGGFAYSSLEFLASQQLMWLAAVSCSASWQCSISVQDGRVAVYVFNRVYGWGFVGGFCGFFMI